MTPKAELELNGAWCSLHNKTKPKKDVIKYLIALTISLWLCRSWEYHQQEDESQMGSGAHVYAVIVRATTLNIWQLSHSARTQRGRDVANVNIALIPELVVPNDTSSVNTSHLASSMSQVLMTTKTSWPAVSPQNPVNMPRGLEQFRDIAVVRHAASHRDIGRASWRGRVVGRVRIYAGYRGGLMWELAYVRWEDWKRYQPTGYWSLSNDWESWDRLVELRRMGQARCLVQYKNRGKYPKHGSRWRSGSSLSVIHRFIMNYPRTLFITSIHIPYRKLQVNMNTTNLDTHIQRLEVA